MRHCKKLPKLSVPAIARGIGTPLLGDRWVTELARKDVKDQNHADIRTRCNDFAGYKVTSCVIFVRFVSVNKL